LGQAGTEIFLQTGLDRRTTEQPGGQISNVARMEPMGQRKAPPDDRLREAIHCVDTTVLDCFVASLLAKFSQSEASNHTASFGLHHHARA
jgi:hypothetical protein